MNKKLLCAFLLLLFSSTVRFQQPPTDSSLPVIDVHTHTHFKTPNQRGIQLTKEQYFKEWQEAGVVGTVAHTSQTGANYFDLKKRNVIYCAGVGEKTNPREIDQGLRSGKYGCIKIYLGYVHRFASDPHYQP